MRGKELDYSNRYEYFKFLQEEVKDYAPIFSTRSTGTSKRNSKNDSEGAADLSERSEKDFESGLSRTYDEYFETCSGQMLEKLKKYPLTVCIFGAASDIISKKKKRTAYAIGRLIGEKGHHLLYGAGSTGVMGEVARGYLSSNPIAKPLGTTTHLIKKIEESYPEGTIHCVETRSMAERKSLYTLADVVLVLPGGEGTLDELSEFKTYKQLNILAEQAGVKPSHWNGMLLLYKQGVWQQYIRTWEAQTQQNMAPPWRDTVKLVDFFDLEEFL